jgi:hypothetical protein
MKYLYKKPKVFLYIFYILIFTCDNCAYIKGRKKAEDFLYSVCSCHITIKEKEEFLQRLRIRLAGSNQ